MAGHPQAQSTNAVNNESVADSDALTFSDLGFTPPENDVVMDLLGNLIGLPIDEFGVVEENEEMGYGDSGMDVDFTFRLDDFVGGDDEFYVRRRGGIGCNNCGSVVSERGDGVWGCGICCNSCGSVVADGGDVFFVSRRGGDDGGGDDDDGFVVVDCGDEFFVSRRGNDEAGGDDSRLPDCEEFWMSRRGAAPERGDSSAHSSGQERSLGSLTVADIGLDLNYRLEEDEGLDFANGNGNENVIEVDERINIDVLSMFLDDDNDDNASPVVIRGEDMDMEVGWEVLSNVYDFVDTYPEGYKREQQRRDEYIAELEIFIEQFVDNDSPLVGQPPAATSVMENLLSVVIAREDVEGGNADCAVCKDEISVGNVAKQLPCAHRYHGDCILPWLRIRNTCPVCRHELPTDDSEYERRRAERSGN